MKTSPNILSKQGVMLGKKNAYKVNNSMVNVNGIFYPISHTFVVKETDQDVPRSDGFNGSNHGRKALYPTTHKYVIQQETSWLDDFRGGIIEFYNVAGCSEAAGVLRHNIPTLGGYGTMAAYTNTTPAVFGLIPRIRGANRYIMNFNLSATFAVLNIEEGVSGQTQLPLSGDFLGWNIWSTDNDGRGTHENNGWPTGVFEDFGLCIGTLPERQFANDNRIHINSHAKIETVYVKSPIHPFFGNEPGVNRHWTVRTHLANRSSGLKDRVFWLYDFNFECLGDDNKEFSTSCCLAHRTTGHADEVMFSGNFQEILLNDPSSPWLLTDFSNPRIKSDATFSPGERGIRLISNEFKYAPWERYPHLI